MTAIPRRTLDLVSKVTPRLSGTFYQPDPTLYHLLIPVEIGYTAANRNACYFKVVNFAPQAKIFRFYKCKSGSFCAAGEKNWGFQDLRDFQKEGYPRKRGASKIYRGLGLKQSKKQGYPKSLSGGGFQNQGLLLRTAGASKTLSGGIQKKRGASKKKEGHPNLSGGGFQDEEGHPNLSGGIQLLSGGGLPRKRGASKSIRGGLPKQT